MIDYPHQSFPNSEFQQSEHIIVLSLANMQSNVQATQTNVNELIAYGFNSRSSSHSLLRSIDDGFLFPKFMPCRILFSQLVENDYLTMYHI